MNSGVLCGLLCSSAGICVVGSGLSLKAPSNVILQVISTRVAEYCNIYKCSPQLWVFWVSRGVGVGCGCCVWVLGVCGGVGVCLFGVCQVYTCPLWDDVCMSACNTMFSITHTHTHQHTHTNKETIHLSHLFMWWHLLPLAIHHTLHKTLHSLCVCVWTKYATCAHKVCHMCTQHTRKYVHIQLPPPHPCLPQ